MKTVEIGWVTKPHGLSGEVKVQLHWSGSRTVFELPAIMICRDADGELAVELAVESARPSPQGPILKLAGVDDRGAALGLRGARLCVPRSALPEPSAGEYYLTDLIGALVQGPEGILGEVVEIVTHPSLDSAVIRLADGTTAEQPLSEPWIELVDLQASRLVLASAEALIRTTPRRAGRRRRKKSDG